MELSKNLNITDLLFDRMKSILLLAVFLVMFACKHATTRNEVERKLKKSMTEYLYNSVNNDSSQVKFNVLNVIFFEEKNIYRCEFDVQMTRPNGRDTTGTMSADISKDFKKVSRKR
jgi:hypothetical protein